MQQGEYTVFCRKCDLTAGCRREYEKDVGCEQMMYRK